MSELGKVCTHGSLERSCPICELEAENKRLTLEVERLRGALEKIQKVSARYLWVMKIKGINGIANLVLSPSNDGREA